MLADLVVKKKLNVRDTEKLVSETINGKTVAKKVVKTKLSPQPRPTSADPGPVAEPLRDECRDPARRQARQDRDRVLRQRGSRPRSRTDGHPSRLIRKGGDVPIMKRLAPFFVLLFLLHSGCSEPARPSTRRIRSTRRFPGKRPWPTSPRSSDSGRVRPVRRLSSSRGSISRRSWPPPVGPRNDRPSRRRPRGVRWSSRTCSRGSARTEPPTGTSRSRG